jgi:hypothetical protein
MGGSQSHTSERVPEQAASGPLAKFKWMAVATLLAQATAAGVYFTQDLWAPAVEQKIKTEQPAQPAPRPAPSNTKPIGRMRALLRGAARGTAGQEGCWRGPPSRCAFPVERPCSPLQAHPCQRRTPRGTRPKAGAPGLRLECSHPHHALWGGPRAGKSLGGCQGSARCSHSARTACRPLRYA